MPAPQEDKAITGCTKELADFLEKAGIDHRSTEAALDIDASLQQWRRRIGKRELGTAALDAFGISEEIDQAQLDVLFAIAKPVNEAWYEDEDETMVSTIAARLRIDPSRASRLVSDLIAKSLAQRSVSQRDARRTIVELTERGEAIVNVVRRFKFLVLGEFLSSWTDDEIAAFVPLMARFVAWTDDSGRMGRERFAEEIAEMSTDLKKTAIAS
ncbi:MarR family winged helix-turn-helix transcriptional regulator [Marinibacterium sp. SX1]|uniref:MarR family winged helix-turn-helix transcriptional regulator n=1 Tax=Marinibacterium sp. SX1 TaxID=3388424 RepID=UPI003D175381